MSADPHSEPTEIDIRTQNKLWRLWTGAAVAGVLTLSFLTGFIILPIVQGQQIGLDAWTAICRAVGILPGTPAQVQPVSTASAAPVSQVSWDGSILTRLASGDRTRGAQLAAETCSACHGEEGVSPSADFPHLAGQSSAAIYKQLSDYKTGARYHPQMSPVAKQLTDRQLADVAAYYAGGNVFWSLGAGSRLPDDRADRLARIGDPARGIPACNSCHGSGVGGPIETPTLAGQHQAYLAHQLDLYAQGQRRNDVYQRMRTISARLTPQERGELAEYYQGFR